MKLLWGMLDVENPSPALRRVPVQRLLDVSKWFESMETAGKNSPEDKRKSKPRAYSLYTARTFDEGSSKPPSSETPQSGMAETAKKPEPTKKPEDTQSDDILLKPTVHVLMKIREIKAPVIASTNPEKELIFKAFWQQVEEVIGVDHGAEWSTYYDGMKQKTSELQDIMNNIFGYESITVAFDENTKEETWVHCLPETITNNAASNVILQGIQDLLKSNETTSKTTSCKMFIRMLTLGTLYDKAQREAGSSEARIKTYHNGFDPIDKKEDILEHKQWLISRLMEGERGKKTFSEEMFFRRFDLAQLLLLEAIGLLIAMLCIQKARPGISSQGPWPPLGT
jgi:hypothetical protein